MGSKKLMKRRSYQNLIDQSLSRGLRADVRYLISNNMFTHVWWLRSCEREFLEDLSVFIERESFSAKEKIPSGPEVLNILMQGVATRGGAIIAVGGSWGDVIIESPMLRDTREAKALGYCEVAKLPRDALMHTAKGYPKSAKIIREASLKVAVSRAMMVISMYARVHQAKMMRQKLLRKRAQLAAREAAINAYRSQQVLFAHGYGHPPWSGPGGHAANYAGNLPHPQHFGAPLNGSPNQHYDGASHSPGLMPAWAQQQQQPPPQPPPQQQEQQYHLHMQQQQQMQMQMGWPSPHPASFPPLPGFEDGDESDDNGELDAVKPAEILRRLKAKLEDDPASDIDIKDVLYHGPVLKDDDSENKVVVKQAGSPLRGSGYSFSESSDLGHRAITKLDEIAMRQDATQIAVQKMEKKLERLDSLAEAVAGINLTLKKAAEGNRRAAPYTPPKPYMRLPGMAKPKPQSGPTLQSREQNEDEDFTA